MGVGQKRNGWDFYTGFYYCMGKIWRRVERNENMVRDRVDGGGERCEKLIQLAWNKNEYKEDLPEYMKYMKN